MPNPKTKKKKTIGRTVLGLFRTAVGFQLPERILDKLSLTDLNKGKCLILNKKNNGSHDYYEITKNGQIIRKRRIFDNNGNYVRSEVSVYNKNGIGPTNKKIEKENVLEVERDSLIFSEVPKEVREKLTKHGFGITHKVDTNFDAECEVSFLRIGNMFEQKVRYKLTNGDTIVDVAYFDEKGKQIKVVKNFAVIKKQ